MIRNILSFLISALYNTVPEIFIGGTDYNGLAMKAFKRSHLPALGCGIDVCLIKDVVAFPAGGYLDELVQTLGGLLNEDVPTTRVISLSPKTHYPHLLHDGIGSKDVIFLPQIRCGVLHCPGGLAGSWQSYHH